MVRIGSSDLDWYGPVRGLAVVEWYGIYGKFSHGLARCDAVRQSWCGEESRERGEVRERLAWQFRPGLVWNGAADRGTLSLGGVRYGLAALVAVRLALFR